jgi:predicted RNA-binding protein Jag
LEKQQQVEKLLGDILTLMQFPARLDFKDAADGSLAVAMHFTGEVPAGITAGKKSYLVDSLQFLLNKCINRPNSERRWVTLGVGGFPEPRGARPVVAPVAAASAPGPAVPSASPAAPVTARASAPAVAGNHRPPRPPPPARADNRSASQRPARPAEVDESKLEVAADPVLSALGKALAQKSAKLGRVYAVAMLSTEDRARLLQAANEVPGVKVRVEGEGHFRRLAFMPEKPTAMPKRHAMAVYPDDEEEGD